METKASELFVCCLEAERVSRIFAVPGEENLDLPAICPVSIPTISNKGIPAMVEDDRAAEALRWVVNLLEEVTARYQVVGGLAARAYGARRSVVDLDLYVDRSGFDRVMHRARAWRIWGPRQHRDEHWDLRFAKLERRGVRIELADAEGARYFHRTRGVWVDQGIDFSRSEEREVLGVTVPVMPKEQLVDYKRALARDVDRLDLKQMGIGI